MFSTQPANEPTGGIIEVQLAQTGEGIADCELLSWFVQEVCVLISSFNETVNLLLIKERFQRC